MDAKTRADISLKVDSEWERLGYVKFSRFRLNNLTREINPVFQYMDELDTLRWSGLSPEGYRSIEPVCRLASAMIESPASLAFLHALVFSPRTEIIGLSQRVGYPCYQFRRSVISSIPDSEDPRLALKRLAPNIDWVLVNSEEIDEAKGRTVTKWVDCNVVDNGRNGYQCTIKIQKDLVKDLTKLRGKANKAIRTLSHQLLFAAILCHEVVHALNCAIDPALVIAFRNDLASRTDTDCPNASFKYCEPFFEDQVESELGHCWENAVFGGNIIPTQFADDPILLCKWPNHKLENIAGFLPPPRRAGYKGSQTLYIIPAHFIQSIQQQTFWDRLDPANAIGLRVQKMTGFRQKLPPGTWVDVDWEPSKSSEGDWPADEQSWVYRNEEPDVVARLYSTANLAATAKWLFELPNPPAVSSCPFLAFFGLDLLQQLWR